MICFLPPARAHLEWPIMLPFGFLLLAIALGPLIAQHHWERHYHKLCASLAGFVCLYYLLVDEPARVLHAAIDYATFMVVVGAFFVVSGGIHLRAKGPSSPVRNTLFLLFGAVFANLIGTIGASMLLIRPWIAITPSRIAPLHLAFFMLLVSYIGYALLPTDPHFILEFLIGISFGRTLQHCWPQWLITVGIVLLVFVVLDFVKLRGSRNSIH